MASIGGRESHPTRKVGLGVVITLLVIALVVALTLYGVAPERKEVDAILAELEKPPALEDLRGVLAETTETTAPSATSRGERIRP